MTRGRRIGAVVALAGLLGGCSLGGVGNRLGVPGGGGPAYEINVMFDDVQDLVPRAAVKVNDVTVGSVQAIDLVDYQAKVRLRIREGVTLPADAVATLRQTSLLGEKFVELATPEGGGTGRLAEGATIPASRTDRNPEVEEVFSALSAVLNGGGLPELQTIAVELTKALAGRETQIKSVFDRLDKLVGALDSRRGEITRAIDALDSLTSTLAGQRQVIADALDAFTPALTVLADQRQELTKLLGKLDRLAAVGSHVIRESGDETLQDLALLRPVLDQVVTVKDDVSRLVDDLVMFTRVVPRAIPGDYLQLLVTIFVSPETLPVEKRSSAAASLVGTRLGAASTLGELLAGVAR